MNRGSATIQRLEGEKAALASMRPRFMNRGSYNHARECASFIVASMRPRFMNRGSHTALRGLGPDDLELQ